MTNAEARFSIALRPRKPEGSLGRTARDGHLDSHTAPELCKKKTTTTKSSAISVYNAMHDVTVSLSLPVGPKVSLLVAKERVCPTSRPTGLGVGPLSRRALTAQVYWPLTRSLGQTPGDKLCQTHAGVYLLLV